MKWICHFEDISYIIPRFVGRCLDIYRMVRVRQFMIENGNLRQRFDYEPFG